MSLKYALLALLTGSSLTGYDLGKQFGSSVGHVWNAPSSQIYPELRRLATAGLLEVEEVTEGRRKKRYTVTSAGLVDLTEWLNTPVPPEPTKDLHILRAAYLDLADHDAARSQMELLITSYTERMHVLEAVRDTLSNGTHPRLAERLRELPPEERERATVFKIFAFDGMIDVARQQIAWARRGLRLIDELEAGKAVAG